MSPDQISSQSSTQPSLDELIKNKEYARALAILDFQTATPDNLFKKADILIKLDKLEEAETILKSLDGKYPQDELAYTLGLLYQYTKRYDEAKFWFKVASRYRTTADKAKQHLDQIQPLAPDMIDEKEEKIVQLKPTKPDINFSNVVGLESVKQYLNLNLINAIKYKERYEAIGKRRGIGLVMYGPPGTGKTLMAKAIAGESGAYFLAAHINQLISSYVGNTSKNISQLFLQARMHRPCVIFIDEIDILGTKRGNSQDAHSNVAAQGVNSLLTELDGVDRNQEDIYVISATNRPWELDPALKRGKRLGDSIYLSLPNKNERKAIIEYYLNKIRLKNTVQVNSDRIARATEYYSPADLDVCIDKSLNFLLDRKERVLTTEDILKIIRYYKSSTINWFESTRHEIQGRPVFDYSHGKAEIVGYEGGKLNIEERDEYAPMIADIKRITNKNARMVEEIKATFAKYIA